MFSLNDLKDFKYLEDDYSKEEQSYLFDLLTNYIINKIFIKKIYLNDNELLIKKVVETTDNKVTITTNLNYYLLFDTSYFKVEDLKVNGNTFDYKMGDYDVFRVNINKEYDVEFTYNIFRNDKISRNLGAAIKFKLEIK